LVSILSLKVAKGREKDMLMVNKQAKIIVVIELGEKRRVRVLIQFFRCASIKRRKVATVAITIYTSRVRDRDKITEIDMRMMAVKK